MTPGTKCGPRKTPANSLLKNLPPARQREIYEYLKSHSLVKTKAWLAAAGLRVSVFPLHVFYHWYPMAAALRASMNVDQTVAEFLQERPDLKARKGELSVIAETVFVALAVEREDPQFFLALCKTRPARARR